MRCTVVGHHQNRNNGGLFTAVCGFKLFKCRSEPRSTSRHFICVNFCPRQYVHWYGSAENCANPVRSVFADIPNIRVVAATRASTCHC